jgi:hypothetical protein
MSFSAGLFQSALLGALFGITLADVLAPRDYQLVFIVGSFIIGPVLITIWELTYRRKKRRGEG